MTSRSLPVPDGLEGERVDAALARLLGLSRTRAAELAGDGAVRVDGRAVGKSDRLVSGSWLEVELPDPAAAVEPEPQPVPGMIVRYEDDDVVVVDKPVGVAAHPSPGWTGPTVVGAPESRAADIYRAIARRIAVKVAERARDMSAKFPNIVVQNT